MLPRVLETEAMDTLAEAIDYDTMDHREVNRVFVADLLGAGPGPGWILDLGTGTAQIPIELCRQHPAARVLAVDMAWHMLRVAQKNVCQAGLAGRIRLQRADAKRLPLAEGSFCTVASNSIVHHVPEPSVVFEEAWRVLAPGGLIFLRDLFRPDDERSVRRLVERYAPGANEHQKQMFADSFRASLTVAEVRQIVVRFGVSPETVQATSDRHWTWATRKG
ncbi:MAG: class I SAM-dependent methyltransferase [Thermoguttaceae bacterium]